MATKKEDTGKARPTLGLGLIRSGIDNVDKGLRTLKSDTGKTLRKGMSLHIGLNRLDPLGYPRDAEDPEGSGWEGPLVACENDAEDMHKIAAGQGFDSTLLLTEEATSENVMAALRRAAKRLTKGDTFLLTYSGHGGQVDDVSGDERDDDVDETWCLFDRQMIDDELYAMYADFKAGVNIFVLSDSCHSGTVTRAMGRMEPELTKAEKKAIFGSENPSFRVMPRETAGDVYYARWEFYDDIQNNVRRVEPEDFKASIRLISACQDDQEAADGLRNGKFTGVVKKIWRNGRFNGGFREFHDAISNNLKKEYARKLKGRSEKEIEELHIQTPNYNAQGAENDEIDHQPPFSI